MSDAFQALDDYFWSVSRDAENSAPDGAFDWICMMHEEDWALLRAAWPDRPSGWRAECAYVLGQGPYDECLPFLAEALFDGDIDVALEAASSYSALLLERESIPHLSLEAWLRLHALVDAAKSDVSEVRQLLRKSPVPDVPQDSPK